jgi:DNA polymerase/3'-5' exonuclease PolX
MNHAEALTLAEEVYHALAPYCTKIRIAGSIRRQKPEVRDCEIVCVRRQVPSDLFGDETAVDPDFCAIVNQWRKVKGEPTGRYTQRVLPSGMKLDLFMADADDWEWQLCLRTGSAGFNQHVLLPAVKRQGLVAENGYLTRDGQVIPTNMAKTDSVG